MFLFRAASETAPGIANCDVITDFTSGADVIDLRLLTWSGAGGFATSGPLAAEGALYQGGVLSIDLDGDAQADLQIELSGAPTLTLADIWYEPVILYC